MLMIFFARCLNFLTELLDTLKENPDIFVNENILEESESFTGVRSSVRNYRLPGNIILTSPAPVEAWGTIGLQHPLAAHKR